MKKISVFYLVIIYVFFINLSAQAASNSVTQSSWSREEIEYDKALGDYENAVKQLPKTIKNLEEAFIADEIDKKAYRNGMLMVTYKYLESYKAEREASINLDRAYLKALSKGGDSINDARNIYAKIAEQVASNRIKIKKRIKKNGLAGILESEIKRVYGDQAVPFDIRQNVLAANQQAYGMLTDMEEQVNTEYARLMAAGDNFSTVREVLQDSLEGKAQMLATMSDLADAFSGLSEIGDIPDYGHIIGRITKAENYGPQFDILGKAMSGVINSFAPNGGKDHDSYSKTSFSPESLRENLDQFMD